MSCVVAVDVVVRHGGGSDGGVLRGVWCNIPCSTLLNLGDIQLQQTVKPRQKLLSIGIISVYLLGHASSVKARAFMKPYLDSPILPLFVNTSSILRCRFGAFCAAVSVVLTVVAVILCGLYSVEARLFGARRDLVGVRKSGCPCLKR